MRFKSFVILLFGLLHAISFASPVDALLAQIENETRQLGKTRVLKIQIDVGPITGKNEGRDLDEVCDMPTGWVLDGSPQWHESYRTGDSSWNGANPISKGSDLSTARSYMDRLQSETQVQAVTAEGTRIKGRISSALEQSRQQLYQFRTGNQAVRYTGRVAPSYREYSVLGIHYSDLTGRGCLRGELRIPIKYAGDPDYWQRVLSLYSRLRVLANAEERERSQRQAQAASPAPYSFSVNNMSADNVWVAIRFKNSDTGVWETSGWQDCPPGLNRLRALKTINSIVYLHAGTTGATKVWIPEELDTVKGGSWEVGVNGSKRFGPINMGSNHDYVWPIRDN